MISVYLMFAGALPFIFCAGCLLLGWQSLPVLGAIERIMMAYGLVIAVFMSGIYWGLHFQIPGKWRNYLLVISNVFAVMAWLVFLQLPPVWVMMFYFVYFLVILWIDRVLWQLAIISGDYYQMRKVITGIVCLSLLVCGAYL